MKISYTIFFDGNFDGTSQQPKFEVSQRLSFRKSPLDQNICHAARISKNWSLLFVVYLVNQKSPFISNYLFV